MTPIADMLEAMLDRDTPIDVILLAIRAVERNALRNVTVTKRSPSAVRQARYRENCKQNQPLAEANDAAKAGDLTVTPERNALRNAVTDHCDLSSSLTSLSGIQEVKEKKKSGSARGTRLLPDAKLPDDDRKFAVDYGVAEPLSLWAEFVDYWIGVPGQRGTKLNWSATWRNRVRAVAAKSGKRPIVGGAVTITPKSPSWNPWKAYFRDTGQNTRAMLMDKSASDGKAFTVPSEYPPGYKRDTA